MQHSAHNPSMRINPAKQLVWDTTFALKQGRIRTSWRLLLLTFRLALLKLGSAMLLCALLLSDWLRAAAAGSAGSGLGSDAAMVVPTAAAPAATPTAAVAAVTAAPTWRSGSRLVGVGGAMTGALTASTACSPIVARSEQSGKQGRPAGPPAWGLEASACRAS